MVRAIPPGAPEQGDAEPERRALFASVPGGRERVLLVEDDALVRRFAVTILESLGYTVIACSDGHQALAQLEGGATCDLLLTDLVLPGGMSGADVADAVIERFGPHRVLFMSGYIEDATMRRDRLDPGVNLLGKPFRLAELAHQVRQVLDAELTR